MDTLNCQLKKIVTTEKFIWWESLGLQAQETASQVTLGELLRGGEGRSQAVEKFVTKGK